MDQKMRSTRLQYNITYTEIAAEAGLQPGAVYAVELEHPLFAEDKSRVQEALKRLIERKIKDITAQETVQILQVNHRFSRPMLQRF